MEVILNYIHIVGLCIWLGSMVTWAVFAPKLNKFDPSRNTTSALRDSFSKISWSSYLVSLISGISILLISTDTSANWRLEIGLLVTAGVVIAFHSLLTNVSEAVRGAFNGVMLILALVVVYLATVYI